MPRGLTLLEVLATLAILAIVAAMALPSMSALQQRHRLVAAAETLASDLTEARFEAARMGQALHVQARVDNSGDGPTNSGWCWAVSTRPHCGCSTAPEPASHGASAPACQLKQVQASAYPGISLLAPLQVLLAPQGGVGAVAGTELQSRHGDRLRVEVAALGRSRICVPAGAQALPGGRYASC